MFLDDRPLSEDPGLPSLDVTSHPASDPVFDLAPIRVGEVWANPVTGERATLIELPGQNPEGRVVAELTAMVGSRVVGEHRHPSMLERFTVLQGELTVRLDGSTSVLAEGQASEVQRGQWHDWWNAAEVDALVRVEAEPGERFMHGIETLFGLAQLGHTNAKGMPDPSSWRCSAGSSQTRCSSDVHRPGSSASCSPC